MHFFAYPIRHFKATSAADGVSDPDAASVPLDASAISHEGGFLGFKALLDALNPWDIVKAFGRSIKWLVRDSKHRNVDVSYDLSFAQNLRQDSAIKSSQNGPAGDGRGMRANLKDVGTERAPSL